MANNSTEDNIQDQLVIYVYFIRTEFTPVWKIIRQKKFKGRYKVTQYGGSHIETVSRRNRQT